MRHLISILFLFAVSIGFGQVKSESVTTEDKEMPAEETVSPALDDENMELEKSVDSRSRNDKKKAAKNQRDIGGYKVSEAPAQAEAKDADASTQGYSNSFEFSKRRASVQRSQRSPSSEQQMEMNEVVGYFEQNAPNSFEYHYFKYVAGNYDVSLINHLKEAEKIKPNNADVHVQLAAYYMIIGDNGSAKKYMNKLVSEKRLNVNLFGYAEDILLSTPQNGTLVTHGFDDSYSVWYEQNIKGIRRDVTLISLDFMQSSKYRANLKNKGYKMPSGELINVDYFGKFCELNSNRALVVSMTTPKEYLKPIMSNMYVTGLVFSYKTGKYDNFPVNEKLWSSSLKKDVVNNPKDDKTKKLSSNYLPMLLQMRKVYNQQNEVDKVKEIDKYIDKIGVQCNKYVKVQGLKQAY